MTISLVRVESEWHAFSTLQDAWTFYCEWRDYRDCELRGDVPVDVDEV